MYKFRNANVIHYSSWKSPRVVRSSSAAEVYALTTFFDYCLAFAQDLSFILGKEIPVYLITDSKSLFDTVTKLTSITEKRLLIDVSSIRQSYYSSEIRKIGHVRSECNLADPLTKRMASKTLANLLRTGKLYTL